MQSTEFVIVGCGPAGGTAAREAARAGVETVVLERDAVVGAKRVCAAGLRPGFCAEFHLPRSIVHLDPPSIALHTAGGRRYDFTLGPAHTTTREELDGAIGDSARHEGAAIRTNCLYRGYRRDGEDVIVEYADYAAGERKTIRARALFLAQGSTACLNDGAFAFPAWAKGLITCYQYRVYPERPALAQTYQTLEMHYYRSAHDRPVIGWMFPKRDHLSIGLGIQAKVAGDELRATLDDFLARVQARLFPGVPYRVQTEGALLYGGKPRPRIEDERVMLGGTAAGLVDATTGEGIYEAASSGRFAAAAVARMRSGAPAPGAAYARALKQAFYRRLHHRQKLMSFLEERPARFDVLFSQLAATPRFADLLQRDRNSIALRDRLYLYGQAARFGLRALFVA